MRINTVEWANNIRIYLLMIETYFFLAKHTHTICIHWPNQIESRNPSFNPQRFDCAGSWECVTVRFQWKVHILSSTDLFICYYKIERIEQIT